MTSLDDRMKNADPARGLNDADLTPQVLAKWARVQATSPSRRGKWRVTIPVIAIALATTGAAVVAPTVLGVGEQNNKVEPDVQIPIRYETSSGAEVSCSYALYLGGDVRTSRDADVATIVAGTDWTGLGQDIYDFAVSSPHTPQEDGTWTNDSAETRQAISFKLSVVPMIEKRLPSDLQGVVEEWRMTDTCEGPFR